MEDDKKLVAGGKTKKNAKKDNQEFVKNTVELHPKLNEAANRTVVLGWGRMNPITSGHEILVNKIKEIAKKQGGKPIVYLTHSADPKKNPLSYNDKVRFAKKAFGPVIQKSNAKTIIQAAQELQSKYDKLVLVAGADRVNEFQTLLNKYNGKDFTFDSIEVVSAGERADPDSDAAKDLSAANMSASVMRKLAAQGNKEDFLKGLPRGLVSMGDEVYNAVRSGMKIIEEMEAELMAEGLLDEAPLDLAQRRKRGIIMRKYRSKIAQGRRRAMRRKATQGTLKKRARRAAITVIRKRLSANKSKNYADLSFGEKKMIDAKVQKRKAAIDRLATKLLPTVRKKEMEKGRTKSESVNEDFDLFIEGVAQDQDIKDKPGTQPKKYFSGLAKSTKDKRDAHFKKGASMDDNNPDAYKPAPGDADAKTKESKHTKKFKDMYGEEVETPAPRKKRFHQLMNGDGTVKHDMRFKRYKVNKVETNHSFAEDTEALRKQHEAEKEKLSQEHEREMDRAKSRKLRQQIRKIQTEEVILENDIEFMKLVDEICESVELEESKTMTALKNKAEKTGISYGILKKVYDRGVAAWRTGHRPGTTPAQWGMARVNSFATKSKGTWGKADSDLAAKVRSEEMQTEGEKPGLWDNIRARRKKGLALKKPGERGYPNTLDIEEEFQFDTLEESEVLSKALAAIHKHVMNGVELGDIAYQVSRARGVNMSGRELEKKYVEKHGKPKTSEVDTSRASALKKKYGFSEEGGAGEWGTDKLKNRYKKDTPGQSMNEEFEELMEAECQLIGLKQIKEFEKVVDGLFKKFGIDFNFTRHFGERMSDERNTPCITMRELADFIKKIYAKQGKSLKGIAGAEAVIKDMQTDLNIPVAVTYDSRNDEFDVVMKTIMRKKNFKTPNQIIKY